MLENNTFNLINQLSQESKSLWRIKNEYLKDAEENSESKAFWEKMLKDKEEHIEDLNKLIKENM